MENEENRGFISTKASKDQLVTFFQFIFRALSLYSLLVSLLKTGSFPGAFLHWVKKGKEGKRK